MQLSFHDDGSCPDRYPHGYWYAKTDNGDYDADGPDPLTAVSRLALSLEQNMEK